MTLQEKYTEFILHNLQVSKVESIVFLFLHDLKNRKGFRQHWETLDDEGKEQLIKNWINLIKEKL